MYVSFTIPPGAAELFCLGWLDLFIDGRFCECIKAGLVDAIAWSIDTQLPMNYDWFLYQFISSQSLNQLLTASYPSSHPRPTSSALLVGLSCPVAKESPRIKRIQPRLFLLFARKDHRSTRSRAGVQTAALLFDMHAYSTAQYNTATNIEAPTTFRACGSPPRFWI